MTSIRFCFLAACLLTACSQALSTATPAAAEATDYAPTAATCRVLEATGNESRSKLNVNLLLGRKIQEEELRALSARLRDSLGGYAKSYFAFYLLGMQVGGGAWATAQFTPAEEIKIWGATQVEEDSSKRKLRVTGRVIGKWYEEQRSASGLAFYEQGGTCYLKRVFRGGTPSFRVSFAPAILSSQLKTLALASTLCYKMMAHWLSSTRKSALLGKHTRCQHASAASGNLLNKMRGRCASPPGPLSEKERGSQSIILLRNFSD